MRCTLSMHFGSSWLQFSANCPIWIFNSMTLRNASKLCSKIPENKVLIDGFSRILVAQNSRIELKSISALCSTSERAIRESNDLIGQINHQIVLQLMINLRIKSMHRYRIGAH